MISALSIDFNPAAKRPGGFSNGLSSRSRNQKANQGCKGGAEMVKSNGCTGRINTVIYARVSSKEQEREGFSIPAELELLRNYARQHGIVVIRAFVESE